MRATLLLSLVLCASLCSCIHEDDDVPAGFQGRVNEDDIEFDQEALLGNTHLTDLKPEQAKEEIKKYVLQIDSNEDGYLDRDELMKWIKLMDDKTYLQNVQGVFKKEDTDHDGFVTFEEYMINAEVPEEYVKEVENMQPMHKSLKAKFDSADLDKDGRLSPDEFAVLASPERHAHMIDHLVNDQLLTMDEDKDGRISFEEYWKQYNPTNKVDAELPDWALNERKVFKEKLDKNKDDFLDREEIKQWLASDDEEYYREEVQHLLDNADKSGDEKLTMEEVLDEFEIFIDSPITDFGAIPRTHEEL